MIGASIYGFVDYKQSSKQKDFAGMYTEEKAVVRATENDLVISEPAEKKEITNQSKTIVERKKVMKDEDITAGIKPIPVDQKLKPANTDITVIEEVNVVPAKEKKVIKTKKRRKLDTKLFSRAPLREELEDEELILPDEKVVEKREIKKQ